MKIQVSKIFAKFINETAKKKGFQAAAAVVDLSENQYRYFVGDVWEADQYGDYNYRTGKYKAIIIEYPAAYYASPVYLTTAALNREYRRAGVRDLEGLENMIQDLLEI